MNSCAPEVILTEAPDSSAAVSVSASLLSEAASLPISAGFFPNETSSDEPLSDAFPDAVLSDVCSAALFSDDHQSIPGHRSYYNIDEMISRLPYG